MYPVPVYTPAHAGLTNLKITQEGKYMDKTYNSEFSCDLIMGRHEQS
jgi:hypothetical protein